MSKRARGRGGEQDAVAGCAVTRGKERAGKPLEQRKGDPQATAGWRMALKEKGWLCGMGQALPWSLAAQIWQARLESRKGRAMRHKQKQYWYLPTHLQHHHNRRHPYDTPRTTVYPLWGVTQQKAVARPTLATCAEQDVVFLALAGTENHQEHLVQLGACLNKERCCNFMCFLGRVRVGSASG